MARRSFVSLLFALLAALPLSSAPTQAQTPPAWDTRNGFAASCGTTRNPVCAITSGPGCITPALFQAAATALRALPVPDISGTADRLMNAATDITELPRPR